MGQKCATCKESKHLDLSEVLTVDDGLTGSEKPPPELKRSLNLDLDSLLEDDDFQLEDADMYLKYQNSIVSQSGYQAVIRSSSQRGDLWQVMDRMMELVWPSASEFANHVLFATVEPAVRKALGSLGKGFTFDKESFSLGNKPVKFRDVRIHKSVQSTEDANLDNIIIRADLQWEGDLTIDMKFETPAVGAIKPVAFNVGVHKILMGGVVIMECVGMTPRPPMFQGVRIYFINPPELDMEFTDNLGLGGAQVKGILNLSTVKRKVLQVMSDEVSKIMVVPNRIGQKLDQGVDFFRIASPSPQAMLRVSIIRAEGIPAMDGATLFHQAKSDPFVIVQCGAERFQSKTIYKTLSPKFNLEVDLPIFSRAHQRVQVKIFDEDITKNDFIGALDLATADMMGWGSKEVALDLADDKGKTGKNGKIWMKAEYRHLYLNSQDGVEDGVGIVFAGVYSASNVPRHPEGTLFWVTAQCTNLLPGRRAEDAKCGKRVMMVDKRQDKAAQECQTETRALVRKVEILRKLGASLEDMAEILDVSEKEMKAMERESAQQVAAMIEDVGGKRQVTFHSPFLFFVERGPSAAITFELRCQEPPKADASLLTALTAQGSEDVVLGKYMLNLADHPFDAGRASIEFPGTEIVLNFHVQLRLCGKPQICRPSAHASSSHSFHTVSMKTRDVTSI
eukprot:gnl/TRDRNA2_/TRDRNA2_169455_c0_seq4.p1 gnl/TRDRNA2_/TRDRNA2_169455_c0~~gnl/TRDRNA2_/TRDRNA2_169455_c0_seq4.p1  ORF type:complete len:677 (-),score=121.56 gnl/TRDRNA2_/TRDRNA2_169455_c0_seq4:61-2091(-)